MCPKNVRIFIEQIRPWFKVFLEYKEKFFDVGAHLFRQFFAFLPKLEDHN